MSSNIFSTDIDRDNFEMKPTQAENVNLFIVFGSAFVIAITGCSLLIYYADKIDAFMNTLAGGITIVSIFGVIGIVWFLYRIRKMME